MECNKDEALRAKEIAEQKFQSQDYETAKKFLLKAQRLFPQLEGLQQMVAVADVHTKAQAKIGPEMDWYGILGLEVTSDDGSIKKQYRKLALVLHPDKNNSAGAEAAFKLVGEAFAVLSDKAKRSRYDLLRNFKPESNVQSKVVTTRQPAATGQSYTNTFWTFCVHCRLNYQYNRNYVNCRLFCQKCRLDFIAVETSEPSLEARNGGRRGGGVGVAPGFFPFFGHPAAAAAAASAGVAAGMPGMPPTSQYVKQVFEQAKKERKEESTRKKQSVAQASVVDMFKRANRRAAAQAKAQPKVQPKEPPPQQQQQQQEEEEVEQRKNEQQNGVDANEDVKLGGDDVQREDPKEDEHRRRIAEQQQARKRKRMVEDDEVVVDAELVDDRVHPAGQPPRRSSRRKRVVSYNFDMDDDLEEFPSRKRSSVSISVSDSEEHSQAGDRSGEVAEPVQKEAEVEQEEEDKQEESAEPPPKYDFDELRSVDKIKKGQFWLIYDDLDGMPRWYCRVESVLMRESKVRVKWLEVRTQSEEQRRWTESGHYISCGKFSLMNKVDRLDSGTFCQQIKLENDRSLQIFPKQGEIWAVFHEWSPEWIDEAADSREYKYVAVEVVCDYTDKGVKFARLRRVQGRRMNIFVRDRAGTWEHCAFAGLLRFSHRIPAVRVGEECRDVPAGSWELDGEATDHLVQ